MKDNDSGRSPDGDGLSSTTEPVSAVSALRASIPSATESLKALPFVTASTREAPHMGWPEAGLKIWASRDLAIVTHHNFTDIRNRWTRFQGFTQNGFHYCPDASWDDWVLLAKRILEVDALASGIEAGTGETPVEAARSEGQEPGPEGDAHPSPPSPPTGDDNA